MGYSADVVTGYGFKVMTCDLEYNGDPQGVLAAWQTAEETYGVAAGVDGVMMLMAGDSRAPMPDQAYMLVIQESMHEGRSWRPSAEQLSRLEAIIAERGLKVDEGPAYFEETFIC